MGDRVSGCCRNTHVPREKQVHFELNEHVRLVQWLCAVFSSRSFAGDPTGWLLGVLPEVVLYEDAGGGPDIRGYGVELRAAAFASSESRCAERLSRVLAWITELLLLAARAQEESP